MKKQLTPKGFTILEVVVALLLFSLLMGSLWEFFGNTYSTYVSFDKKTNLNDHSRMVSSFIREEIRLAEEVTIKVTTDEGEKEIHPPTDPKTPESSSAIVGELIQIELDPSSTGSTAKGHRWIKLIDNTLIYEANSIKSLISDKVDNIKVTREEDSADVQFECTLAVDGAPAQTVKNMFSESLDYKE